MNKIWSTDPLNERKDIEVLKKTQFEGFDTHALV